MDKLGEIISRVERRRKWTPEQKVKILTELLKPGATVSAVADRNGISRSQLYTWKKLAQRGAIPGISLNELPKSTFVPVRIEAAPPVPTQAVAAPMVPTQAVAAPMVRLQRRPGAIEIVLTNGRMVRADAGIEPIRLARLVAALDGTRS
jgi:transposase